VSLRAGPWSVAILGRGCLAAALLLWASGAFDLRDNIRERSFDNVLPFLASAPERSARRRLSGWRKRSIAILSARY
jgi:hypothetical protein